MIVDFDDLRPAQVYMTLIQCIIPRPIAWVLSENAGSGYNLAPFSYFNAVCSDPPLILFSVGTRDDGSFKDTRVNIEQRGQFVVHICDERLLTALNETAADEPPGVSELDRVDLPLAGFDGFRLPRIRDARIALACDCHEIKEIGSAPQSLILGHVRRVYVDDDLVAPDAKGRDKIHADKLRPIGRLGASEYVTFGDIRTLKRPG